VERHLPGDPSQYRLFTTADGLDLNHVESVEMHRGNLRARTAKSLCTLERDRFVCEEAKPLPAQELSVAPRYQTARVTATLEHAGLRYVATSGNGLWLDGKTPRRLTPHDQICSNHVMAMETFDDRLWFGSFDEGLCSTDDGQTFVPATTPFRMINDLLATPDTLYVAAGSGLYRTLDGETFERVEYVYQRGVNGLAFDGRSLFVTTPGALWRIRVNEGPKSRTFWMPGGSTALQSVSIHDKDVWLASEDRGAIRMRGRKAAIFDRATGLPTSWALDVAVDESGTAFVATLRNGALAIDPDGKAHEIPGLPDDWLLFAGAEGDAVWLGTQGGAVRVGKDGVATLPGVPHPCVHAIFPLANEVYVGTEGGTLVLTEAG
jgi:hypothetical protein